MKELNVYSHRCIKIIKIKFDTDIALFNRLQVFHSYV